MGYYWMKVKWQVESWYKKFSNHLRSFVFIAFILEGTNKFFQSLAGFLVGFCKLDAVLFLIRGWKFSSFEVFNTYSVKKGAQE